ncbi:hypothetical protein [Actinoplanes regularis]|uniref:Uncharacterized protein n=1 Tax=Actinoplanes regularis TaxID=52697 RepID=A0A239IAL7_9ACTN|nr:hypothetical protein [Actinoplanes regularis]GIE90741.1 hypothetical protein Are01nite_72210 [Actinoplanes regularis]SNS90581.1 hypothetical protein SAMN06264365_12823 [Actinoplanes regularis]
MKVDEHAWTRARGWTLSLTMISPSYYRARNPALVRTAVSLINDLLADFAAD